MNCRDLSGGGKRPQHVRCATLWQTMASLILLGDSYKLRACIFMANTAYVEYSAESSRRVAMPRSKFVAHVVPPCYPPPPLSAPPRGTLLPRAVCNYNETMHLPLVLPAALVLLVLVLILVVVAPVLLRAFCAGAVGRGLPSYRYLCCPDNYQLIAIRGGGRGKVSPRQGSPIRS